MQSALFARSSQEPCREDQVYAAPVLGVPRSAGSGTIDIKELKTALTALGQSPSDEELFVMVSQASAPAAAFSIYLLC